MLLLYVRYIQLHYLSRFSVFARDVKLSVLEGQVKGSSVLVCPKDTQALIFMCECTGVTCKWFVDPVISSSNAFEFIYEDEPGHIQTRNELTAFLIKKIGVSPKIMYESQLIVPLDVIRSVQSPVEVVCENDKATNSTMSIDIITPGTSDLELCLLLQACAVYYLLNMKCMGCLEI